MNVVKLGGKRAERQERETKETEKKRKKRNKQRVPRHFGPEQQKTQIKYTKSTDKIVIHFPRSKGVSAVERASKASSAKQAIE